MREKPIRTTINITKEVREAIVEATCAGEWRSMDDCLRDMLGLDPLMPKIGYSHPARFTSRSKWPFASMEPGQVDEVPEGYIVENGGHRRFINAMSSVNSRRGYEFDISAKLSDEGRTVWVVTRTA